MFVTVPTTELFERVRPRVPAGVELELWDWKSPAPQRHVDLAVLPYMVGPSALEAIHGADVAAVQAQSLGYNGMDETLPQGVVLCNAVGVHEGSTAELALALVLAATRDLPRAVNQQREGDWTQYWTPGLVGRRVLVLGVGGVGGAIADRLRPFEVDLVRMASRARTDEHGEVHGPESLPELVSNADVVVIGLPLTEQTEGLFDADMIARMKPGALLVNVGRGSIVDTDALVEACREGRISAALDVMEPEPLPQDHPLWTTPGVLLVPHLGGRSTSMDDRVERLVVDQVERLTRGEELAHRVL